MRILFCNIAWMKYYKGDVPGEGEMSGGGAFVKEHGWGHEAYNFCPTDLVFPDGKFPDDKYCLGFVETMSRKNISHQLHIEKIDECQALEKEESAEGVRVVYCAKHPQHNFTTVVGWYRNATVFRHYQEYDFQNGIQSYNAIARAEDCVLLPLTQRSRELIWKVPRKTSKMAYGFGHSNVWYANDPGNDKLNQFLKDIVGKMDGYSGENWLNTIPEDLNPQSYWG